MAEPTVVDEPVPPNPDVDPLPIPPLDPAIFSDPYMSNLGDSFADDLGDFDFIFDDCPFPDTEDFTNSLHNPDFDLDREPFDADPAAYVTDGANWGSSDRSSSGAEIVNYPSPVSCPISGDPSSDVAKFLNVSSPGSSVNSGTKGSEFDRVSSNPLSEAPNGLDFGPASSQGSGNSGSAVLGTPNYQSTDTDDSARSAASPNSSNNSAIGFVGEQIKLEEGGNNNSLMKRKKQSEDVNSDSVRTSKYRRSNPSENANQPSATNTINDEDEKKKARLMRNRESAQLSRQRKKHYVEELEDKVRALHTTIQDLNTRMSYVMAENASLRQQLSGGTMCPPPMAPPGMYPNSPMAPMGYPWMPCPPYVMKSQGSQVPLVPIPRLKPKQPGQAPKSKKVESKTKKVASVSFLGLLFFIALFGVLSPMINSKFESDHLPSLGYKNHHPTVLNVNGSLRHEGLGSSNGKYGNRIHCGRGAPDCEHRGRSNPRPESKEFARGDNSTESLVASLYVPRNDKLVKIDGNLIIHSVLASEKAMASQKESRMKSRGEETSLAVAIPGMGRNSGRHPHLFRSSAGPQRALGTGSTNEDNFRSTKADGKLQQWFQEGLAGPLLSSGMCTEVFQFDVSSAPGAIIPATTSIKNNVSAEQRQNATHLAKGVLNRRILPGAPILPLAASRNNITRKQVGAANPKEDNFGKNNSSMVVSVLFDPREAGVDGEADGVMGPKSLSRIFVVVLIDSIKYVTYSCMLPLKGSAAAASAAHLVTA